MPEEFSREKELVEKVVKEYFKGGIYKEIIEVAILELKKEGNKGEGSKSYTL